MHVASFPAVRLLVEFSGDIPTDAIELFCWMYGGKVELSSRTKPDFFLSCRKVSLLDNHVDVSLGAYVYSQADADAVSIDIPSGRMTYATGENSCLVEYLSNIPFDFSAAFILALERFFSLRSILTLHAACFSLPEGMNVLVLGESHAGKSTCALAALVAGNAILSDDTVWVNMVDGVANCSPARFPVFVRPGAQKAFDRSLDFSMKSCTSFDGEPKFYISRNLLGQYVVNHVIPDAIVFLNRNNQSASALSVATMSHAEVYAAIIGSAAPLCLAGYSQVERAMLLEPMAQLSSIPGFSVALGSMLLTDPVKTLTELEREIAVGDDFYSGARSLTAMSST